MTRRVRVLIGKIRRLPVIAVPSSTDNMNGPGVGVAVRGPSLDAGGAPHGHLSHPQGRPGLVMPGILARMGASVCASSRDLPSIASSPGHRRCHRGHRGVQCECEGVVDDRVMRRHSLGTEELHEDRSPEHPREHTERQAYWHLTRLLCGA